MEWHPFGILAAGQPFQNFEAAVGEITVTDGLCVNPVFLKHGLGAFTSDLTLRACGFKIGLELDQANLLLCFFLLNSNPASCGCFLLIQNDLWVTDVGKAKS